MAETGRIVRAGGCSSLRTLASFVAVAGLLCGVVSESSALIGGASVSTAGSNGSGNSGDGSTTFGAAIQLNNGVTLATRYEFNVNADIGIFSTEDQSGTASHVVTFNATAPGGYRLDISENFVGDLNRVNDASGCDGAADVSGVSGSTSFALSSGTLTVPDPGSIGNGGSTTSLSFSGNNGGTPARIFRVSNGVAQPHTLTFSWTASTRSNSCEAAVRIGAQNGSTTGCTACVYPGSPSRNQPSDGHFVTITFTSLCGNSTIDSAVGEQCDLGAANGTVLSCCSSQCKFKTNGTQCRGELPGGCDFAETCNGASPNCPADTFRPNGTVCRAASPGEICDVTETCTGTSNQCPPDAVFPSGTTCRASGGSCDLTETCDGASKICPNDAKVPNGTVCRAQNGLCDVAETCNGVSNLCPTNGFASSSVVCRGSAGFCDLAENCTGSGPNCPGDGFKSSAVECRAAGGFCDTAENCTGGSATCPNDSKKPAGTTCRAIAGICDLQENCDGSSNNCPPDVLKPNGTSCNPDPNPCTVDQCNGSSPICQHPAGNAGATCRADAGACDVAEVCHGASTVCPADSFEPSGTSCPDDGETCTIDECDGSGVCSHPAGNAGANCRTGTPGEVCDVDEVCDGINGTCPPDLVTDSSVSCRATAPGDVCDVEEFCDGVSKFCPPDAVEPNTTECRPDAGDCDVADNCDGVTKLCPPNAFELAGTPCASDGQTCTADICNGLGACTHPAGNAGTVCRADAGECDVQETCNGVSTTCPANAFEPSGTPCTSDGQICTLDQCNGSGTCAHPAGNAGTECRSDAGECDVAEQCDGSSTACPPDGFEPNGTSCTDDGLFCTGDETCQSGSCVGAGDPCTVGTCEESSDQCLVAGCSVTPIGGCRTAGTSIFLIKNKTNDTKDKMIWKWIKGLATIQEEFADPITTADYTLCVYSGASDDLVASVNVPPSFALWTPLSSKGYKYKDAAGSQSGIQKIILKGSTGNKAKILMKGKGLGLPDPPVAMNPTLALDLPVLVQMVNSDNGICFEAEYDSGDVKKNVPDKFKAKAQ